nr:hypothetical protein BaRGS_008712 [Batillaria attramentaria]
MLGTPSLVVSDLDLVRDVLVKKFAFFPNRVMTQAIERVAKNLHIHVKSKAETGEEVELKKLCRSYAIDNIAGVAFGLQVDSLKDPNDPFIKHGTDLTTFNSAVLSIIVMFPFMTPVLRMFGITFPPQAANSFFMKVLDSALKERRFDSTKHTDFLQLLVEAEREGETQGPVDAEIDHGLTQDEMYSNTFIFLFAGNETVSAAMSFTLFCLAANPDCLAKAQAEVDARLGKVSLDREAHEDTEIGGYHVAKGTRVLVPVISIHRDPAIWPDPMTFDPERHTPEARATRHPYAFMPFGLGPRNCIGMRLAQLEIRMAIATILQHFTPVLCDKSVVSIIGFSVVRILAQTIQARRQLV